MRHRRIPKSVRHKKFKSTDSLAERNFVKDDIIQRTCDQPIPKKLKEIMESKQSNNRANSEKIKKSKLKINPTIIVKPSESFEIQPGMTRIPKPLPDAVFKEPGESKHHFMNRLNKMVAQSIAEATLEEHFEVDLGEKIPSSSVDNQKLAPNHSKMFQDEAETKKIDKKREKNRLNKLRRKAKKMTKQHRLVKQLDKIDDPSSFARKDPIDFGEIVHCPPSFEFKNKKKLK